MQSSKVKAAYFWTVLGSTSRYLAGLGISIVLARLLKPEDYGLVGMILLFVEFLVVFFEGMGSAVVHFKDDQEKDSPTYFTAALILGAVCMVVLFAAAPLIAAFYKEPRLIPLLRVMSLTLLIGGVRQVSGSILARRLNFKDLAFADIFSSLTGGFLAITLAYMGFGAWSLVCNLLVFSVLQLLAYGRYARPHFEFPLNRETLNKLVRYGAPATGSGWLYKVYDNADYLVVGKMLGPVELGFYTVAFRLAMLANERVSAVVNRVAFPAFANAKDDFPTVIEHWFAVTRRVTLITFPMLVWLAMSAGDFVPLVLGAKWHDSILPLRFLCVMTAIKILTNVIQQMLQAIGFPEIVFKYDVLTAIVLPTAFVIGCKYGGLWGMGIAWCTAFPILRFSFVAGARKVLPFSLKNYALNLKDTFVLTAVGAAAMSVVLFAMHHGWPRFLIQSAAWFGATAAFVMSNEEIRGLVVSTLRNRGRN